MSIARCRRQVHGLAVAAVSNGGDNPNLTGGANRNFACFTDASSANSCDSNQREFPNPACNPVPALALGCWKKPPQVHDGNQGRRVIPAKGLADRVGGEPGIGAAAGLR